MAPARALFRVTVVLVIIGGALGQGAGQPPRITEHPSDATVPRLSPVTLNCQAAGSPAPQVRWVKDGRRLVSNAAHRVLLPRGSLFLLSVRRRDAGVYWCVAQNRHGADTSRNATLLVAVLREEFRVRPSDTEAAVGDRVTLRCSPPRGDPPPTVRWLRDGSQLDMTASHRYRLAGEGDLVIDNVTRSDAGDYVCEARNYAQMKRLSKTARLSVRARPRVGSSSSDVTVLLGETVQLTCPLAEDPATLVFWRRLNGGRLRAAGRGHVIPMRDVTAADGGLYECRAGSEAAIVDLSVHALPEFRAAPPDHLTRPGSEVNVACDASGYPEPVTFWTRAGGDRVMFPGFSADSVTIHRNGSLYIKGARRSDESLWSCFAVSEAGAAVARGYLWVSDPEGEPGTPSGGAAEVRTATGRARLRCPVTGGRVEWYRGNRPVSEDGQTRLDQDGSLLLTGVDVSASGRYRCIVTSPSGQVSSAELRLRVTTSTDSGPVTSSVTLTSAEAVNSSAVRLEMQVRPDLGEAAELRVLYSSVPSGDFRDVRLAAGHASSVMVTGLRPDTTYRFFVLPVTAGGADLPSNLLLQRTTSSAAPDQLSVRPLNTSTALVSWRWPADVSGSSPVRVYRVFLRCTDRARAANETSFTAASRSTQVTLYNLSRTGQYTVRVAAETADGVGPASAPLRFTLSAAAPPVPAPPPPPPPPPSPAPPSAGLLGQQWFAAALVALLGLLLLLLLAALLVCLHRRRRSRALSRAVGEKRPAGLALLPSGVRPASWMEGSAWGAAKTGVPAELSCRALPAFTDELQPPPPPPRTAPSPYATTALLDNPPPSQHCTDTDGVWTSHRITSRESLPTFCRATPLKIRSQSSNVLLSHGHRHASVLPASRHSTISCGDQTGSGVVTTGGTGCSDWSSHLYEALAMPKTNRPAPCDVGPWSLNSACSRYSLEPGGGLQAQPPRSRSFAVAPLSARRKQKKAAHCVSTALSDDLSAACRNDPRDIYRRREPSGFGTTDR